MNETTEQLNDVRQTLKEAVQEQEEKQQPQRSTLENGQLVVGQRKKRRTLRQERKIVSGSPELRFLTNGDLVRLVIKDPLRVAAIAQSILLGKPRDFSKDSEHLAKKLEPTTILGKENIPVEATPIIIACNHPDIYNLALGTVQITQAFNEVRKAQNAQSNVHWLIADSIPPRDVMKSAPYKALYGIIGWGMKKLLKTYEKDFISVPVTVDVNNSHSFILGRAKALFAAKDVLKDTSGSQVVGMFPEGDITRGDTIDEFYKGIGVLARSAGRDVTILPTSIARDDKNKLTIIFGQPLVANREDDAEDITNKVRNKIDMLGKKPTQHPI